MLGIQSLVMCATAWTTWQQAPQAPTPAPTPAQVPAEYVAGADGVFHSPLERFVRGEMKSLCTNPQLQTTDADKQAISKDCVVPDSMHAVNLTAACLGLATDHTWLEGDAVLLRMSCDSTPFQRKYNEGKLFWRVDVKLASIPTKTVDWVDLLGRREGTLQVLIGVEDGSLLWIKTWIPDSDLSWVGEDGPPEVLEAELASSYITDVSNRQCTAVTSANLTTLLKSTRQAVGANLTQARQVIIRPVQVKSLDMDANSMRSEATHELFYVDLRGIHKADERRAAVLPHQDDKPWFATNYLRVTASADGNVVEYSNAPHIYMNCDDWWSFQRKWLAEMDHFRAIQHGAPADNVKDRK